MDILDDVAMYLVASPLAAMGLVLGLLALRVRRAHTDAQVRARLQPPR